MFPNNADNQQLLFGESQLSVKRIRGLGGDKHDRVYVWQFFCRDWLAKKGIHLNSSTNSYRNPTVDKIQQREEKLERWKREIESLEREAQAYCNRLKL